MHHLSDDWLDGLQNLLRRYTQDANCASLKPSIAFSIARRIVAEFVCDAVDFDNKLGGITIEIGDEATDRVLAPELEPAWLPPELPPEKRLRQRHRPT